jgi:hypothetical protein
MRHVPVDIPYAWAIHPHPTTRIRPVFPGHGQVRRKRTPVPTPGRLLVPDGVFRRPERSARGDGTGRGDAGQAAGPGGGTGARARAGQGRGRGRDRGEGEGEGEGGTGARPRAKAKAKAKAGQGRGRGRGRRRGWGCGAGRRGRGAEDDGRRAATGGRGRDGPRRATRQDKDGRQGCGDDLAGSARDGPGPDKQTHRWPQGGHGRPLGQRCDRPGPAASGLARIRADPCDTAAKESLATRR